MQENNNITDFSLTIWTSKNKIFSFYVHPQGTFFDPQISGVDAKKLEIWEKFT